ncbi:11869_t:CDS:1, partial [Diversispora eburnea]
SLTFSLIVKSSYFMRRCNEGGAGCGSGDGCSCGEDGVNFTAIN